MSALVVLQSAPEWASARIGRVTASRMADLLARTKSGWGASRANYMAELAAERLTGVPAESYISAAMQRGMDTEDLAKRAYAFQFGCVVQPAGFILHPFIPMAGATPDGFIGEDGHVEFKCPNTSTHIDTLLTETIPDKYIAQMQWQMACSGRAWCDYVSFDPRLPEELRLFARRVERDEERIKDMEIAVEQFLEELDEMMRRLVEKMEDGKD